MKSTHKLLAIVVVLIAVSIWWNINKNNPNQENVASGQSKPPLSNTASDSSRDSAPVSPVLLDEPFERNLYKAINYSEQPATVDSSRAFVRVPSTSSRLRLMPNEYGEFPVQATGLGETVAVRMEISDAKPGTPVAVTIMDGGTFPGGSDSDASRLIKVEDWGGISFQYTTSSNAGHHRLRVLPSGAHLKILDFYATKNSSSENL
jgi:hypothetical protein